MNTSSSLPLTASRIICILGFTLCIIVVALGFTLLGESLREALDPKFRR